LLGKQNGNPGRYARRHLSEEVLPMNAKNLARLFLVVCLLLPLPALPQSSAPQSGGTPLAPAQLIKPADLTQQELSFYQTLDSAAASDFLVTRSYVRLCQQVVDRKLPAAQLPHKPAGFSAKYLLPTDPNVINRALADSIMAHQNPGVEPPAQLEMTPAQVLNPSDLSPDELAYYKTLTDPATIKSFIDTRSFVRLCQTVVNHELPIEQFPVKPLDFNPSFLLPGEADIVNEAIGDAAAFSLKQMLKK
jgi:hypothetical protein